jgi:hypothetical protein
MCEVIRGLFGALLVDASSHSAWSRSLHSSFRPVLNKRSHVRRELAVQLSQQVEAFGRSCSVRHCTVLGGMDQFSQSLELQRRPHIVVATPGRLADMLNTSEDIRRAFKRTAVLVVDEADRVLEPSFEDDLATIMRVRLCHPLCPPFPKLASTHERCTKPSSMPQIALAKASLVCMHMAPCRTSCTTRKCCKPFFWIWQGDSSYVAYAR